MIPGFSMPSLATIEANTAAIRDQLNEIRASITALESEARTRLQSSDAELLLHLHAHEERLLAPLQAMEKHLLGIKIQLDFVLHKEKSA